MGNEIPLLFVVAAILLIAVGAEYVHQTKQHNVYRCEIVAQPVKEKL